MPLVRGAPGKTVQPVGVVTAPTFDSKTSRMRSLSTMLAGFAGVTDVVPVATAPDAKNVMAK